MRLRLGRVMVIGIMLSALFVAACQTPCSATVGDPRFAMSGWKGWDKFDEVGSCWFLNWGKSLSGSYINSDYPYLRMYWRTKDDEFTAEEIQDWAIRMREAYGPGVPIWWTASNEPNDRGQANQTPEEFAPGYYHYYRNLKIGDPECKVLGPGLLNWTFYSDSVWKKGKEWYEEFRQIWANDPTYSAYSQSIQGNPYPPMDGFNMHTYDLRGIQGTIYVGPPDWKYLREQTLACYADLQTYPETRDLKIWNTEYSSLRAGSITDSADTLGGIGLWFRQQPFMEHWFFFILASSSGWQNTVLLDSENNINSLGRAHYTLSTLGDAEVYNMPFDADYNSGAAYTREGSTYSSDFGEDYSLGVNFFLNQDTAYTTGEMRGRTYTSSRRIKRVTFNYRMTCDTAKYQIEVDVPGQAPVWTSGANSGDQWADVDLSSSDLSEVSFGLYCTADDTYTGDTRAAKAQINNITFWFDETVETTPGEVKSIPDKRQVRLDDVVVSAVFLDSFAVQDEGRTGGILVYGIRDVAVGDRCTVTGITAEVDGSRVLTEPEIANKTAGEPPEPVMVNTRAAGGGGFGLQEAVVDDADADSYASGLSNVGLLLRSAGTVSYVDPSDTFFYLDDGANLNDGSGYAGVRYNMSGVPTPIVGTSASVTGICCTSIINGKVARLIRPRGPQDAVFGDVASYLANGSFETGETGGWTVVGDAGDVVANSSYGNIYPVSGNKMFACQGYYEELSGTMYQTAYLTPGADYVLSAMSSVYHWSADTTAARNRIGIDPTGGTDPEGASVVWTDWHELPAYASGWQELTTPAVTSSTGPVTVFLQYSQSGTYIWNINCFDAVVLTEA